MYPDAPREPAHAAALGDTSQMPVALRLGIVSRLRSAPHSRAAARPRPQRDGGRATLRVDIVANVLNRMLDFGRPEYVRTA